MRRINSDGKNSAENRGGGFGGSRGIRARMRISLRRRVRAGAAEPGTRCARRRGSAGPCSDRCRLPLRGAAAGKVTGEDEIKWAQKSAFCAITATRWRSIFKEPCSTICGPCRRRRSRHISNRGYCKKHQKNHAKSEENCRHAKCNAVDGGDFCDGCLLHSMPF